jgi:hypothetical protein
VSACCDGTPEGTPLADSGEVCPRCGTKGAKVDPITLKALLTSDGLRRGVPSSPRFCATASCPVVYFDDAEAVLFEEELLTLRVYAKHPEDERVPICYCFGYTAESIRAAAMSPDRTASEDIAREVKAGRCACEVKNPKGSCCLGDVTRVESTRVETAAALR